MALTGARTPLEALQTAFVAAMNEEQASVEVLTSMHELAFKEREKVGPDSRLDKALMAAAAAIQRVKDSHVQNRADLENSLRELKDAKEG